METLITILVLVLLSGVSSWLKKRAESQEQDQMPPPPPRTPDRGRLPPQRPMAPGGGAPEPRPATRSWEEELRRLLEGELPLPPKQAPPPPPVKPQPLPPVIAAPRPGPPVAVPRAPAPTREPVVTAPVAPAPVVVATPVVRQGSVTARRHAQRVGERAELELKRAELEHARTLAQTHVARRGTAPEIIAARAMLSQPQSARQAVILSVILGPPVGF